MVKRLLFLLIILSYCHASYGQRNVDVIREAFLNPSPKIVLVAAHRAPHSHYPENSLKAIEEGISLGIDIVEIDVKVSKDGVPFLMHDHNLDRTTTGKGEAEAYTWDELQQFFLKHQGQITNLKIPKLEDALRIARDHIMVDLDLKTDGIEEVIRVVNKTNTGKIVIFFDSDFSILSRVRSADKDFLIMPRAHSEAEADSIISVFAPPIVHIDFSFYTPETTRKIASSPARIWINALGDVDRKIRKGKVNRAIRILTAQGANVVQTDEPQRLLLGLQKKGLHP